MNTIITSQFTLEPLEAAHAREMFIVLSDPAIYEFENAPPESEEWLRRRYARLQSRGPDPARESWLNWVVRLPGGELAGYVQATILGAGKSLVAYELASRYWRRGLGSGAVSSMLEELAAHYGIHTWIAVLKARNFRSAALLRRLGFVPATVVEEAEHRDEADEIVMMRSADGPGAAWTGHPRLRD